MAPISISMIIFACVFGGAMLGLWLRDVLPEHHLSSDSKDVIKLTIGLIGTMSALLLSLLIASAKGSFDTRRNELTQMATSSILLDRTLAHYGPETAEIRAMLRLALAGIVKEIWSSEATEQAQLPQPVGSRELLFDKMQQLVPRTDTQRSLQSQAESFAINLGQTRWLLLEQVGSSIPTPFLVVVVFWLAMLFVAFGMLAPCNLTVMVTLLIGSISVAGAIFLILELDHPFSGLIQMSDLPLKNALAVLGK
jgi:Protein of unknown function (DUF4239)